MRNIDKIVESQYPPRQTNVLWFDTTTSELKIYMNGEWVHADGLDEIATDEDIDSITKEELDKRQYFTIETIEDGLTLSWLLPMSEVESHACTIEYSKDDGQTWHSVTSGYDNSGNIDSSIPAGTKFIFRGNGPTGFYDSSEQDVMGSFFNAGGPCYVYGNVMSLLYGDDFATKTAVPEYALASLFYDYGENYSGGWMRSKEGNQLLLPATTLAKRCYERTFAYCASLAVAPKLPAITLAEGCYQQMFYYCSSLVVAPELAATYTAKSCCESMFQGCTSLTTAPELPATTLVYACYSNMFSDCTSLTTAPSLPATTLADSCYGHMFQNCTSLTEAPALPATTLAPGCYASMFQNCTSLTTAPELPATILANSCYQRMFYGCTSLTTAPSLPATTLTNYCYSYMFNGCKSLIAAPSLSATTLADYCYQYMFKGCTSLTTAPSLPATTLAGYCYSSMFSGCTSLTIAPELPATMLVNSCYSYMFSNCTSLNSIICLATNFSGTDALFNWVDNVAETGTFTKAAGANWPPSGISSIPEGWTVVSE